MRTHDIWLPTMLSMKIGKLLTMAGVTRQCISKFFATKSKALSVWNAMRGFMRHGYPLNTFAEVCQFD